MCRQVLIVWFGEFPEVPRGFPRQAFSILMAITGLAAFAIVLALVEQLVLQILTENVSRGSQVYEEGHILVLAWAVTQRDREVIWKILSQVRPHHPVLCRQASGLLPLGHATTVQPRPVVSFRCAGPSPGMLTYSPACCMLAFGV